MGTRKAVVGASMVFILSVFSGSQVESGDQMPGPAASRVSGIRTDGLSAKQLEEWRKIHELVLAEDTEGRPLHPTLRRLWAAVDTTSHTIFIEMPETKSYFAGRFEMTHVDPAGSAHEGRVILNLRAIRRASTGPAAAHEDGFVPFKELGRTGRYAEVLGHELAHAAWHLASVERARLAQRLQGSLEAQALALRASDTDRGVERESELDRLVRVLEEPAETAERAIWEELRASQRAR